ncbi:hypothetical protein PDK21_23565 [Bacillus cereus group sp. TH147LC]|uniref:hypothetical protein n=2 Tax=Bacillus cereus group TaxID=86661 RepID=UPI001952C73F|nr:hypothetical protein [Bacillus pacificus]MDA1690720.1 hypothetical protein [Bacillus cereus group sp. TH147LC]
MRKRIKRKNYQMEKEDTQIQKDRSSYLQDTAWIITILTGAIYFFSYSFQKGIRDYYGIDDISLSDLDVSLIVSSVYDVSSLILRICILYFISRVLIWCASFIINILDARQSTPKKETFIRVKLEKFYSKIGEFSSSIIETDLNKVGSFKEVIGTIYDRKEFAPINAITNGIFLMLVLSYLPFLVLKDSYNFNVANLLSTRVWALFIILLVMLLFLFIVLSLKKLKSGIIKNGLLKLCLRGIVAIYRRNPLAYIWKQCNWGIKGIIIIIIGIGSSWIFFQYGYTKAEKKEDYTIVQYHGKEFVMLDKDKNRMLASPLTINNHYMMSKNEYQLIELKQGKTDTIIFKGKSLVGGLQVSPNERKESLKELDKTIQSIPVLRNLFPINLLIDK